MTHDATKIARSNDPNLGPLQALPRRKSMGQHVHEHLKQSVVRGAISPGSRLVESRIADAMGVSRTPVREALHKLEREGLLRKQPQGGFIVLGLNRDEIEETFGIRSVLEGYAAKMAAIKHEETELRPLEEKIHEYRSSLEQADLEALPEINTEFHDLLYALSRSPRLVKMINDLRDQIFRFRQMILKNEENARVSHEDHLLMIDYIRKRRPRDVEKLAREHILRGQAAVLEEFDRKASD